MKFKPQLKSDVLINFNYKARILISLLSGTIVFIIFNFFAEANVIVSISLSILFVIFVYFLCSKCNSTYTNN